MPTFITEIAARRIYFSTLLAGGTLYLVDKEIRNNVEALFRLVDNYNIKTLFLPTAFLKLIESEEDFIKCIPGSVDHIVAAGEQLVVTDRFKEYLQANHVFLHNHYGPSEAHVVTALTMEPEEEATPEAEADTKTEEPEAETETSEPSGTQDDKEKE